MFTKQQLSFDRMLNFLSIFIAALLISFGTYAQSNYQDDVVGTTNYTSVQSTSCDNTVNNVNPDFLGKYRRLDYYPPYVTLPKTIMVAMHVFTGAGTYQNTAVDIAKLNQIMSWTNAWYLNNALPSDPIGGVVDLPQSYIHFELDNRIYFYSGTGLENSTSASACITYIQTNNAPSMEYLPIIITLGGGSPPYAQAPYPTYISTPTASGFGDYQYVFSPGAPGPSEFASAQTLSHELGHCMDLMHTYQVSCCHEVCDATSTDYLPDVFGTTPPINCWHDGSWGCDPYAGGNTCTNNIMGGTGFFAVNGFYFSPLQIAKMHRACYIKSVRRYVKECPVSTLPFIITQDEVWDFDIRMYQNIEVNNGATLTIRCNVHMPEGTQIIVHNGGALILDGATIDASCSDMWAGIVIETGGSISTLNNTLVQDAQYGVFANDGTVMSIDNTTFNRCYIGIFVPDAAAGTNTIVGSISGSTFECDNILHSPYPGQTPSIGTKTYAGIKMSDIAFNINGGVNMNTFKDLNIGIYGNRSSFTVADCYFLNIQPDVGFNTIYSGAGIYMIGGHGYQTLKQSGFGSTTAAHKSFERCRYGIFSETMNNSISGNYMYYVTTGIRVQYCSLRDNYIIGNLLDCDRYGVYATFNDGANHLNILSNYIYIGFNITYVPKGIGIYDNEFSVATTNHTSIGDNHIHINNGWHGIFVRNVAKAGIGYNTVDLANFSANEYGISLQGCDYAYVTCNGITSTGIGGNTLQRGMFVSSSTNSTIACNSVDNTYHGIRFDGYCGGTTLEGNGINNHRNGLFCGTTSVLGDQNNKGNVWNGSYLNFGAIHAGNYLLSRFFENPFSPPLTPIPASISPASNVWFIPGTGAAFNCGFSQICNALIAANGNDPLDLKIAEGDVQTPDYTEPIEYTAKRALYKKLSSDNALLNSNPNFQTFYNNETQGNADELQSVGDGSDMLFNMTTALRNQIDQNKISIEQDLAQIEANSVQLRNSNLSSTDRQTILNSSELLEQDINSLTLSNSTALSALEDNRILTADGLNISNDGIITNANYDENERQVNSIYLQTIAIGIYAFTENQSTILLSISSQCPYGGGLAVYKARGMYALIDDDVDFNDEDICLGEGIVLRQASHSNSQPYIYEYASIYPNPADQTLTLAFEFGKDVAGKIEIFNSMGQKVSSVELKANEHSFALNCNSLSNGIYNYNVISSVGFIQKGKLVITH